MKPYKQRVWWKACIGLLISLIGFIVGLLFCEWVFAPHRGFGIEEKLIIGAFIAIPHISLWVTAKFCVLSMFLSGIMSAGFTLVLLALIGDEVNRDLFETVISVWVFTGLPVILSAFGYWIFKRVKRDENAQKIGT